MNKIRAVVPVKETSESKQRLAGILSRARRQELALAMLEDVLAALAATTDLPGILVVTADPAAAAIAQRHGADVSAESAAEGHTAAVADAALLLASDGLDMLTVPADIPLVQSEDIQSVLAVHSDAVRRGTRVFCIVPARDERGSNAVLSRPARAVPLIFGENSFLPHLAAAKASGIEPSVLRVPRIALDIDTAEDLAVLLANPARTRTHALLNAWDLQLNDAGTNFGMASR